MSTIDTPRLGTLIDEIEEVGYCRIPGVYSKDRAADALDKVRWWYERTKDNTSDNVPFLNIGQPTVYNLQNKDPFFPELLFEPEVMQDILVHFLNDQWFKQIPEGEPNYILRSYIARSSNSQLPMHLDSFVPYTGSHVFIMQYSIILEDQNADNGCTVVVPGSHLAGEYTTQDTFDDAVRVESEAGDVVIWDSRLWHGTTENASDTTRWAIV
ncbi:MAG: phytanoyl-CoA dioxygenase family protein, partial [Acidimicrobiia bacterium]|nr:phytanoyl-CoA dioxygenase family protein [Acidimicrobiia bacterium]